MEPIMSQSIKISFYDYNVAKRNDRIASLIFDYHQIKKNKEKYNTPKWYNLYGAQSGYQRGIARKMNQGFVEGTAYRGQCLLSLDVTAQKNRPKKGLVDIGLTNDMKPKQTSYIVKCDLYEGCEIYKMFNTKMYIQICIGRHSAKSKRVNVKDGRCEWFQVIESSEELAEDDSTNLMNNIQNAANKITEAVPLLQETKKQNNYGNIGPLTMPDDIDQCPDIFIYLCGNNKRISYLRIPFKNIVNKKWKNAPKWYNLKEDKAINALEENVFPGSVLLAINAGRADSMPHNGYLPESRPFILGTMNDEFMNDEQFMNETVSEEHLKLLQRHQEEEKEEKIANIGDLIVYIQQAQHLPAMDNNGKSDPFVKLKICDIHGDVLQQKHDLIWYLNQVAFLISFSYKSINELQLHLITNLYSSFDSL